MSKNVKKIDIFNKLRSSGLRPTKQRVEIAKYLFEREKTFHFTVESLNKLLEKKLHLNLLWLQFTIQFMPLKMQDI